MRRTIILAAFSLILTSCTLESMRYGAVNSSVFPKNASDCEALVIGNAYAPFRSKSYDGLFACNHDGIQVLSDMASDIGDCAWSDVYWPELITLNPDANLTHGVVKLYRNYISSITRMTKTLERISSVEMEQGVRDRMNAELYCARGWLAFILYNFFGPIQIATQDQLDNPAKNVIAPRATEEETVKFIEENLLEALKNDALPVVLKKGDANYGRFTQALVHMVLLKFYMHQKRWDDAVKEARELTNPKYGFGLMDHYQDIFTLENEGNKETVWACECTTGINEQLWVTHAMPSDYPHKNQNMTLWGGGYKVIWSFYNSFDPTDERLKVLVGEYVGTDGVLYNQDNPGRRLAKGALPIKYGEDPEAIGEGSQIDYIVFRYADVLLMLSEAIVRSGNAVTSEAVSLLSQVHERAGLPALSAGDFASAEDFLDAVLEERGHELWFEGFRREDLIRYGKYIEYMKTYKHSSTAADYMVLFPLPQDVINEGGGIVHQNDGY